MKSIIVLLSAVALTSLAVNAGPKQDISGKKHPNLAAAQRMCDNAYEKVSAAQSANEFDMGGHAAKAKELLEQASKELKAAAEAANENKK
jgi:hypothetical protein